MRAIRFLLLMVLLLAPVSKSFAQTAELPKTPEAMVAALPDADFDRKVQIANALAASGYPRAALIIGALADGTLFSTADGKIVLHAAAGSNVFSDALTGVALPGMTEDKLTKIGVNNRLRRDLHGLSARLSLRSPDAAIRRKSADDAFTAHDPDSLPAIEEALKTESVASIRAALAQARASILLQSPDSSEKDKLESISVLRDRGDRDALNAILILRSADSPTLRDAAAAAQKDIESSLAYWGVMQNVYYGLSLGSVLLLAGIGLAITFGVMGIINMAHGEMIMLGAYTTYVVQQALGTFAPDLMPWSLPLSVPVAFVVAGAAGILIERSIIRFLYGRPLETLLATWGLSLIIQQMVRTIFGAANRPVSTPDWMSGSFDIGHLTVTFSRLAIIIFALLAFSLLTIFLKRTHFGMQMRAVTQNRKMASAMGVRTNWIDALTFGLGSGVAGIAGVALSQIDNVSPNLGQGYIIDSFMVVVFGGVGNLWGTLVGAMTLGVANKLIEPYAGAVVGKILVLVFIILFIQRRPRGLFALKGRAVEA
ncbi:MAG TPA: urea ABC transporter permease subunit UrtB [Micropepsaceae bacterium]|nr:urea ABC transporter permease subunit UrtB [Micropepsaceae bacterium]